MALKLGCTVYVLYASILIVVLTTLSVRDALRGLIRGSEWAVCIGIIIAVLVALFIISLPARAGMYAAAEAIPPCNRITGLQMHAHDLRDEAAIRLALLCEYGCSSPFVFAHRLEVISVFGRATLSIIYDFLLWVGALAIRFPLGYLVARQNAAPLAYGAGYALAALPALNNLRSLQKCGGFSRRDVSWAIRGRLPSDPDAIWCAGGIDDEIYVLARRVQRISVKRLGQATDVVVPINLLAQSSLVDYTDAGQRELAEGVLKRRSAARRRVGIAHCLEEAVTRTLYLWGRGNLEWRIPAAQDSESPLHLDCGISEDAYKTLYEWRREVTWSEPRGPAWSWYVVTVLLLSFGGLGIILACAALVAKDDPGTAMGTALGSLAIWGIVRVVKRVKQIARTGAARKRLIRRNRGQVR